MIKSKLTRLNIILLLAVFAACSSEETSSQSNTVSTAQASSANKSAHKNVDLSSTNSNALFVEGKHYEKLATELPVADKSKIEVVEFFWYGCGHCYTFEPLIQSWKSSLADDVQFNPVPAVWAKNMETHARIFYTIKAMDRMDLHQKVFDLLNVQKKRLASLDEVVTALKPYGIDEDNFKKVFKAFGINSQVQQGIAKAKGAGLKGTPELLVNGKYRVTGRLAGSPARMLAVTNYLIEQERRN